MNTYARAAGFLFLITFVAGGFGEGYAPAARGWLMIRSGYCRNSSGF